MSRRSLQRKAWHLIYKSLPPVRRPGLEPATWQEGLFILVILSSIVYLFVVK